MHRLIVIAIAVLAACGGDDATCTETHDAGPSRRGLYQGPCIDTESCAPSAPVCLVHTELDREYCTRPCDNDCDAPGTCRVIASGESLCLLPE